MAISIVTTALVAQPVRPAIADEAGARSTRADEAPLGNDFFSILLALPAMTASAATPATDIADDPQPAAETAAPTAAVDMLVLNQQLPQTPYRPPAAGNGGGDGQRIAGQGSTAAENLASLLDRKSVV